MIMKTLITLFGLLVVIICSIFSHALMQDIVDPITGRRVRDKEARIAGIIGYVICCAIIFGLCHYLFK